MSRIGMQKVTWNINDFVPPSSCNYTHTHTHFTPFIALPFLFLQHTARVYIEPLSNINITDNVVGETISFGCSIQSCEESIDVSIRKGTEVHQQMMINNRVNERVNIVTINQDLTISEDAVGEYSCNVLLPNGMLFVERFNITGVLVSIILVFVDHALLSNQSLYRKVAC